MRLLSLAMSIIITRLDDCGVAYRALANTALAAPVARHKAIFFPEKAASGDWIDNQMTISGGQELAPTGTEVSVLADDYKRTRADGVLHKEYEPFEPLR